MEAENAQSDVVKREFGVVETPVEVHVAFGPVGEFAMAMVDRLRMGLCGCGEG